MRIKNTLILALLSTIFFTTNSVAEQSQTFDQYTVHYNAINTQVLNPTVASGYKIKRSKNRALLNISVLKDKMGTTVKPVKAVVTATSVNLTSQLREIKIRELEDAGAIYYIGEIPIRNKETLNFEVQVQPEGSEETYTVKFSQQFFTE